MVILLVVAGILLLGLLAIAVSALPRMQAFDGPATVRVPVDDLVMGDLPPVCARTGRGADGLVEVRSDESGFQVWWFFLLVFGPLGIVAIVILSALSRPGRTSGLIPMSHQALAEQGRLVAIGNWAWAIPPAALLAGGALLLAPDLLGAAPAVGVGVLVLGLIGGFLVMSIASLLVGRRTVRVRLDGSGRWVELRNVHPSFAVAVDRQTRARHRARNAERECRET